MKKRYVNFVSIFFAALCFAFTACNGMTTGKGTGTVRVIIGGGTHDPSMPQDCLFLTKKIPKLPLPIKMELNWQKETAKRLLS